MSGSDEPGLAMGARIERVNIYFKEHLEGQLGWYDRKATRYKRWHKQLGFLIIAAGACTSIIPLWSPSPELHWTTIVMSALGVIVALAKGIERIWAFDENWMNYRQAAEAMKREGRLYINSAGAYARVRQDQAAYQLFVERIEDIIAAEHHSFWQHHREGTTGATEGSEGA